MPETKSQSETESDEKSKPVSKKQLERVSFGELFRYADGIDKTCIVFGIICAMVAGGSMPVYSFIFGELIDAYNKGEQHMYEEMKKVVVYVVILGIGTGISYWGRTFFWMFTAERQIKRIREHYVDAILRQEIAWFDQVGSGELTTRIAGDTIVVQDGMGDKVGLFIQCACMFVCGMVMGFIRGWKLALVILSVVPLLAACGAMMMKLLVSYSTRGQKVYATAGNIAEEVLSSIRTVVAFGGEEKEVRRYAQSLDDAAAIGVKKNAIGGIGKGITFFCIFCTYALALWYGGKLVVHDDTYTGGRVINVLWSVIFAAFMLGQAGPNMEAIAKARGAAYTIFQTIDRKPLIDGSSDEGERIHDFKGDIELKDVHFKYPTRQEAEIFTGVSIVAKAGQKIALVGKSGCGKSSAIALLQRFYDTISGQVLLDDKDVRTLNIKWLRQQFGYVGQEPVLFSGTIASNISFGQEFSTEEIENAAKAANAHNFISQFPEGYQTQVGERGAQLSGGQKQRIAIARAIIRNPKILLLDEATSALDSESEKVVQDALDSVMQGRTTIIIAHRLSTIRDVDRIYVINEGKVVEIGTHEELVHTGGLYSELVHSQTSQAEVPKSRSKTISNKDNKEQLSAEKTFKKEEKKEDEEMSTSEIVKRLTQLNKPEIPHLIIGALAAIATGVVHPMFSILLSHIISIYYKPPDEVEDKIVPYVLGFVGLGVGAWICMFLQSVMMGYAGEKLTKRIRKLSFRAMLQQDIGWFDQKEHASGKLTSMLATDATLVQNLMGPRLALTVSNIATFVAAAIIALVHAWKLTLVILATVPLLAFGNAMNTLTTKGVVLRTRISVAEANQVATEAIQNIRTVAAFTNEGRFSSTFSKSLEGPTKLGLRSAVLTGALVGVGQFLVYASLALGYWYGGKLLEKGDLTFLDMMSVFMAVSMGANAIGQNTAMAPDSVAAKVAANSIFKLIDTVSPINAFSPEGKKLPPQLKTDIEFSSVQFTYPTRLNAPVFSDMTLKIPTGKVVALVGPSGCGKSSVVALLERFYDPQHGSIVVDGEDMKSFNVKSWRSQIGLVGQEPVLFSGTIADNISYGKQDATQDEIESAAKAANAHNFISQFPEGYQTQVGEKGTQLSGGQKQRIAIARAIIRNPKILLLDEATSALDSESEKVVQEALDSVMQGRTTIIIAHRLSTIKDADIIYLIQKGRIEETGTHEELMKLGGLYYNLVERQT